MKTQKEKFQVWYEKRKNDPEFRANWNSRVRRNYLRLKIKCLQHYGKGGKCRCCWKGCAMTDPDMLSIDHVNNDGAKDHKNGSRSGQKLYNYLIRDSFPSGFQTLCMNHQFKKELLRRRDKK